jgi:hypothetical protein
MPVWSRTLAPAWTEDDKGRKRQRERVSRSEIDDTAERAMSMLSRMLTGHGGRPTAAPCMTLRCSLAARPNRLD